MRVTSKGAANLRKLSSYEIFIFTKLLPSMLDFGKECDEFRTFVAKTYHFIHYSLKIS